MSKIIEIKIYDNTISNIDIIREHHQKLDKMCLPELESVPLDDELIVNIALDFYANWIKKREEE